MREAHLIDAELTGAAPSDADLRSALSEAGVFIPRGDALGNLEGASLVKGDRATHSWRM